MMKALILAFAFAVILVACGGRVQESCGGVSHRPCSEGFICDIPSNDPDALGTCVEGTPHCGGIAGIPCPEGYSCALDGDYPDAAGTCVPLDPRIIDDPSFCIEDGDCVRQDIACDCGAGQWVNGQAYLPLPYNTPRCACMRQEAVGMCEKARCVGRLV